MLRKRFVNIIWVRNPCGVENVYIPDDVENAILVGPDGACMWHIGFKYENNSQEQEEFVAMMRSAFSPYTIEETIMGKRMILVADLKDFGKDKGWDERVFLNRLAIANIRQNADGNPPWSD